MSDRDRGATVVVPTLNRGGLLGDCLRDLLNQSYQPIEVLVVDQSETVPSEIQALADENQPSITYRSVDFRGLPLARNYGWQTARYERVIFIDDDIRCGPGLVQAHVDALARPGVGAVAGGIDEAMRDDSALRRPGRFNPWTATPGRGFSSLVSGEVSHGPGGNFSVWRDVIQEVGGVDESLNIGAALYEETDLFLRIGRAGHRIWFAADARLTHLAAPSGGCRVQDLNEYVFALARNRSFLIRRHIRSFHRPTALARLAMLALSYARAYRRVGALSAAARGVREGWAVALDPPTCTNFHPTGQRAS